MEQNGFLFFHPHAKISSFIVVYRGHGPLTESHVLLRIDCRRIEVENMIIRNNKENELVFV